MQIELGMLSIIVSVMTLIVGALVRVAWGNREKEIDRRMDEMAEKVEIQNQRLHTEEKATIRQDGKIEKVEEADMRFQMDVSEIKATMARKADVEAVEKHIAAGFARVDAALQGLQKGGFRGTSGQMQVPPYDPRKP
jgi:ABC-type lipoprotein release transport system permease subunit